MTILDNRIGGISIRTIAVATELCESNIETIFVVPNEKGELACRLRELNFQVNQIILGRPSLKRMWANLYWLVTFPLSVFIIASIILRRNIDIIHVNGLMSLQASMAALLTRRRIVWHLASTVYPPFLVKFMMPIICRIAFVVTISESVDRFYVSEKGKCKNRLVVHEPVDVFKFSPDIPQAERDIYRRSLGVQPGDLLIGVVGNITPVKGHEFLVQAVPIIVQQIPNVQFVIVGATFNTQLRYKHALDQMIKTLGITERLRFLGQRHDIRDLLNSFDLFVLPSIFEGTPIAILEAMAMERAVVATRVGGVTDVVLHGETGLLVNSREPEALAHALIELLKDGQKRHDMGKNGRERVTELFSLSHCVKMHKMIYRQLHGPERATLRDIESYRK